MIHLSAKRDCCGCGACVNICTHGSIAMQEDTEGFLYPQFDMSKCVECGLCERTCPMINIPNDNDVQYVYAAKNHNETIRSHSSSGGVFSALASYVFEHGGVVVGCKFNDKMEAFHSIAYKKDELQALQSSKYVQSNTKDIFKKVKNILLNGRLVLFSGTPCQVAALRNYLVKKYHNLICLDILCHGVPSPRIFNDYNTWLEKRYKGRVQAIDFRNKEKDWKRLYIKCTFNNGKHHFLYAGYDTYMQLFLSDRLQRPSCFYCPYNTIKRSGDITLGDFWGIGKKRPEKDDNKGISMVLINNHKGLLLWNAVKEKMDFFASDIETAIAGNKVLVQNLPSDKKRNEFYNDYVQFGFDSAIAKHAPEASKLYQWYYNLMRWGLDLVRKIKHESY